MATLLKTAALAALMAVPAGFAAAQDITLRFQHFVSPASASPEYFMQPWVDAIEEQSGGRLKIELYPMMQLGGSAAEMYDQIADGIVDGGWVIPGYEPGRFPEVEAMELPFMTPKIAEQASVAAWRYAQDHLMDDFADVHVIATHMHGRGLVYKTGAPIATLEEFAGLKLRGPSRPATMLLTKLGATPIGMPVPQFPESLALGVVDGGVITYEMAPSLKLDELTDSHTDVAGDQSLYNLFFIWAMNKDVYESLPDDLKAVIDANSGEMASAWVGRAYDTGDADGIRVLDAAGHIAAVLSDAETARLRAVGDEVTADWIAEMDARGYDGARLVEDARAAVESARGAE